MCAVHKNVPNRTERKKKALRQTHSKRERERGKTDGSTQEKKSESKNRAKNEGDNNNYAIRFLFVFFLFKNSTECVELMPFLYAQHSLCVALFRITFVSIYSDSFFFCLVCVFAMRLPIILFGMHESIHVAREQDTHTKLERDRRYERKQFILYMNRNKTRKKKHIEE